MRKIAILINGELRFDNKLHLERFKSMISDYDVYISTYPTYESIGKELTDNCIIADTKLPQGNMYQWFHLDNIIKKWKDALLGYDIIIKIRTDIEYKNFSFDDLSVLPNTIYPQTDQIFYGVSTHFVNCFDDMFDNVMNLYFKKSQHYYIPLNYQNILDSQSDVDVKVGWLRLPKIIYSKTLSELQTKIKEYKLDYLSENSNNLEIIDGQKSGYPFTSERCFLIQSINKGLLGKSQIFGKLMDKRKKFNYISYE